MSPRHRAARAARGNGRRSRAGMGAVRAGAGRHRDVGADTDRGLPRPAGPDRVQPPREGPPRPHRAALPGQSAGAGTAGGRHQPAGPGDPGDPRARIRTGTAHPVGNGRQGDSFWIIAEHGHRAGYVRNIAKDPRVRVRLRVGWRYRWVPGVATVLLDDDPLARQRHLIRWHPLRALNAINVRLLGADLLTVRVQLHPSTRDVGVMGGYRPGCGPVAAGGG